MKRVYTHIQKLELRMIEMREAGHTRQEIADGLGLSKVQVKNWINRHNKSRAKLESGIPPKRRGRPRKKEITSEEDYRYEIKRLRMENELLRGFLQFTGRR